MFAEPRLSLASDDVFSSASTIRFAPPAQRSQPSVPSADEDLVDLRIIDPSLLPGTIDRLNARRTPVVVAIRDDHLDEVAIGLLRSNIILLCEPEEADVVSALAVVRAATRGPGVCDRDRNADRIKQLNDEVARIAETLARLSARTSDDAGPEVRDAAPKWSAEPAQVEVDAAEIRRTIRARRMRAEIFGIHGLFEDPAWDILLDLFAARLEHRQVSVSSLCIAAAVAPTTGLRWIGRLIEAGLLERRPDQFDRRRAFIVLADKAAAAMLRYVAATRRAALPLV